MAVTKVKVTVTLSRGMIDILDLRARELGSRSAALEEALTEWQHEMALRRLEEETAVYYDSLSKAEREDQDDWAAIASASATHVWDRE